MNNIPQFYDPDRIGTMFYPDMAQIATAATEAQLPVAGQDDERVHLVIIDMQVDFCHEAGSLYVPGAVEDIERLNAFIFRHAGSISKITCTLDSHLPFQIFHRSWWVDAEGNHPEPMTIISAEDVEEGTYRAVVMPDYSYQYVRKLEAQAKKQLIIWPYHVLIGGVGNILDPSLWSVVMWHSLARKTQPSWLVKGTIPQTEHYSALQPEIEVEGHPQSGKHIAFLQTLTDSDYVIIAGEAESHCVQETLEGIVSEFEARPEVLERIYVLQDCMSPVAHPEIDFHALAMERFEEFAEKGINFVDSTDELPFLERERKTAVS